MQIFLCFLVLVLLPLLSGAGMCRLLSVKRSAAGCYLVGSVSQWFLIQLLAVPLGIFRAGFLPVVISLSALLGLLCVYGVAGWIRDRSGAVKAPRQPLDFSDYFALVLMAAGYCFLAYFLLTHQHEDFDDSRFVVSAVDIVRTNRLFLTNPNTGLEITGFLGDMHRDTVSPWAVYIAYTAKLTNTPAAIVAHTALPQALLLCMLSVYWLLADTFFPRGLFSKCSFVFLAFLVNMFGYYSGYTAEAFALERTWQGKAVVAAVGIPAMFLFCAWIFEKPDKWSRYLLLYMLCFALCLMSGMGIILGGILSGCVGLAYGIVKKKISVTLKIWIGTAVCLIYYGVSLLEW